MGKIITYFCDNCKTETSDDQLLKEDIPVVKRLYAMGGVPPKKLASLGNCLEFEEQALCPACHKKYESIWNIKMTEIARDWEGLKSL